MANFIVVSSVRRLAKERGKRVSKGFIDFLDRRVRSIVISHIHLLGGRKTLNAQDSEAIESFRG